MMQQQLFSEPPTLFDNVLTEVYLYVELKQPYLLQYVILRGIAPVQDEPRPPFI